MIDQHPDGGFTFDARIVHDPEGVYLTPLKLPEAKLGDFEIKHRKYEAGRPIMFVPTRVAWNLGVPVRHLVYPFETTWHELSEDGHIWTTDLPCEIQQQRKLLDGMYGNVLVGGLGIGLVASLLAKRSTVNRVHVVERSRNIVKLVGPHIAMAAPDPRVFKFHQRCLFDWLAAAAKSKRPPVLDWAFHDIWRHDGEWTLFKTVWPLRRMTRALGVPDERIVNWNEDVMCGQVLRSVESMIRTHRTVRHAAHTLLDEKTAKHFEAFAITRERVEERALPGNVLWFWRTYFDEGWDARSDDDVAKLAEQYAATFGWASWEKRFGVRETEVPAPRA